MKPIKIDDFHWLDSSYVVGNKNYEVQDLIKAAEDLEEFDLPLAGVNMNHALCQATLTSFLYHWKRVEKADLKYPVIIDSTGYICDGWHRVAKAILEGKTTIKAKRLEVMPEPFKK
jgi:hypothetical protein